MITSIHIFANAVLGKGLSGSDRIFIELAKRLSKKNKVTIHVWKEGYKICKREGLENVDFKIMEVEFWCKFGFFICYFTRIIKSVWFGLFAKIDSSEAILYSASEFWMDSLPAFIFSIRYPKTKWIAAWFQTAPNPLIGFSQGNRKNTYKLSAFYYWFMQQPIKPIIKLFADIVLVNNDLEKEQFKTLDKSGKVQVILGAVNIKEIKNFQKENKNISNLYDGVFQGRFHPQKGVLELINIWKLVAEKLPDAKLAMIGDGPLMKDVLDLIKKLNLENNIQLYGFLFDGPSKYKIISSSKLVLHPAFYDSGGMASAEAMAFGIPCVGFDLASYKSYYPKGIIKVQIGDLNGFAQNIIELLNNKQRREKIGKEAKEMIEENWSWDQRFNQLIRAGLFSR